MYRKEHRACWNRVQERNDARYQTTLEHGKNYGARNLMHPFRRLNVAADIPETDWVLVRRPNRAELL